MGDRHVPLRRVLLPWVTGSALIIMTAMAAYRVATLRVTRIEGERLRLQASVETAVEVWEDVLVSDLTEQLEAATLDPQNAAERERMLRRHNAIGALYLWTAPPDPARERPKFVFPVSNVGRVDQVLHRSPCLRDAGLKMEQAPADLMVAVRAWLIGCRNEDLNVQVVATSRAADALKLEGQLELAQDAIERVDASITAREHLPAGSLLALQAASRRGIDPFRLAVIRLQSADLSFQLGRIEEGLGQIVALGDQIGALDAPDFLLVKSLFAPEIVEELREHGLPEEAARLQRRFDAADRRTRAYKEILERIVLGSSAAHLGDAPRFIYDQYSDQPFVLFYGWSGSYGVALQLEQKELLAMLVRRIDKQLRQFVTITDASGDTVHGSPVTGSDAAVVQLARTLPHLRVHVSEAALAPYLNDDQWLAQLALIGICLTLGLMALAAQVLANRQQAELLDRQRSFTTRVTHELKTPLAGIRVMAENLESGAFRGEDQRVEMAARIVSEVDRLTARVDEVLAAARERVIPSPLPFDPEDVLLELVEEWGPRFEATGARFQADLATTEPVDGDRGAMRDAVACLLDNALKYRREDGKVVPEVWLDLETDAHQVVISVTDNGIGVPRAMRKAVFERFVRVEGANRGKAGGHGLGLHQVREIVRAHRGTVTCTEGVAGGARFEIRLPVHR